jgi:N-acetylmuramoyl-L-alanine amidase
LENNKDFKVIYTRKSDVFVDLIERANIANRSDADLFISIHCDAFSSSRAFGAGTFVLGLHENERNFKVAQKENSVIFLEKDYEKNYDGFDPNDPESVISLILMQETYLDQSIVAASSIQQSFIKNLNRKDRTVKQAGFIVLKYTYMPSVLIETGFLTNASEGAFLNSAKGQNNMADAIARAIINYKKQRDASFQTNVVTAEASNSQSYSDSGSSIVFKVQIAASKKKLEPVSYNFKGLTSISLEKSGKLYRYYYQKSSSYDSAKRYVKEAQNKGFKNAFLVAFDGENKITIEEALKRLK